MTYGSNTDTAYLDWQERQSGSRAADDADDRAHWQAVSEQRKSDRLATRRNYTRDITDPWSEQ